MRVRLVIGVLCALGALAPSAFGVGEALPDGVFAPEVSIQGVPVGGMTVADARATLTAQVVNPRMAPLRLVLRGRSMSLKPIGLGLTIQLNATLNDALAYGRTIAITGPVDVPLRQSVDRARLAKTLRYKEPLVRKEPRNVILSWKGMAPRIWPAKVGYAIKYPSAVSVVAAAVLNRPATPVVLPARVLRPTKTKVGIVLVVSRANRRLTMYSEERRIRGFDVAVGTAAYPTPRGIFHVIQKQKNPTWSPPDSPWAAGLGPIPPGPGNPLGTRWIGTSAPAIGIHGTYADWSVGTAASHGCLRMHISDVEWLYNYVRIGTVVRIV
ncbi:MAG TPA: L,D-transpeptidase family protein [Miltoncostaeales bacterium]|nr:L,D-transpeptidase family protein [Miltoncostaeales bacterium]